MGTCTVHTVSSLQSPFGLSIPSKSINSSCSQLKPHLLTCGSHAQYLAPLMSRQTNKPLHSLMRGARHDHAEIFSWRPVSVCIQNFHGAPIKGGTLLRPLSNRLKECPEFKFLPTIPIPITRWPSPSSVADLPHPTDYSTNQTLQTPHKYYQPTPLRNRLESCLGAARPEGCAVVFLNKSYQGGSLTPLRNCLES